MGHRANLVLGNASGYELFYSHWSANTLPSDLFWGPEHAVEFVSKQRRVSVVDGWLDTIWAEGGAVIDPQESTLLLYGGEDLLYDVPLRRLYLQMLGTAWDNWTIQWAHEGIVDIAEYVGVAREHVIADFDGAHEATPVWDHPRERDWLQCVATIQIGEELAIVPLAGRLIEYLLVGPEFVSSASTVESFKTLDVSDWTTEFPHGGIHVDSNLRQLDFWMAHDCANVLPTVTPKWRDWTLRWHKDRYESHIERAAPALKLPQFSPRDLLPRLLTILNHHAKPVDVMGLARILGGQRGDGVEVNPFAVRDDRVSVDPSRRKAILARCVATLDVGD
ncbi:MAG: hypothetical protein KDA92_26160 [Planctomycetales bacterium]|nr:hypothetical protein [Planctomycetales bacterium]MCA9167146.1 hypothetical protein [Planctomycetales bacterium]